MLGNVFRRAAFGRAVEEVILLQIWGKFVFELVGNMRTRHMERVSSMSRLEILRFPLLLLRHLNDLTYKTHRRVVLHHIQVILL